MQTKVKGGRKIASREGIFMRGAVKKLKKAAPRHWSAVGGEVENRKNEKNCVLGAQSERGVLL